MIFAQAKEKIKQMNTKAMKKFFGILFVFAAITGCVNDDDFDTPDLSIEEPTIPGNIVTIGAVKGQLEQSEDGIFTYEATNTYLEGYVISNDEGGNFFEEIVLQDLPENPTAGIILQVDVNPLFTMYEFGRKIYIKLDGLTVTTDNGVVQLGVRSGDSIEKLPLALLDEYVIRSTEVASIIPLQVTISDFSEDLENLFVQVNNVQFNRNDVLTDDRKTFASEPTDEFDGERLLESCASGATTIVSTSTFADFKGLLLPQASGSIQAVLGRDFFDDFYVLAINSPADIIFDGERCDPEFLACEGVAGGSATVFSQDFEESGSISFYEGQGWTNINVNGGSTEYIIGSFSGSNYAQISGFNSGEDVIETWLVTPAINLDASVQEDFTFDIQVNYDNGNILSVLITDNFTGDVTTTDWTEVDVTIPTGPSGGFGTFTTVGPTNISCLDGDVHIAFKYDGSDPSATTRYHIDNIQITGN